MRVLLLGAGAREHAIGETLVRSGAQLFVVASNDNPGLQELARDSGGLFNQNSETDSRTICEFARSNSIGLAVIGLEDPLAFGVPDALNEFGIGTVGPVSKAAQLETSKLFARELMRRYHIDGQVNYSYFIDPSELSAFLRSRPDAQFALKPVGLTAGKGVKVMGVQLESTEDAIEYGRHVIETSYGGTAGVLVEEALEGEEFTLQAFVDGQTVSPMPLVRDYKRANEGDEGPNTGSMGSYSQADGFLRFVGSKERDDALAILESVVRALREEGTPYHGILYGQFMLTSTGLRVVEFNARFGDPEALNVLPLLETNFVDVCNAIVDGALSADSVTFKHMATVCKYITPPGYPDAPEIVPIEIDRQAIEREGVRLYFAKVKQDGDNMLTTPSRFAGLVGIADTVEQAEAAVERALTHVKGRYRVRHDIGKAPLLNRAPIFVTELAAHH